MAFPTSWLQTWQDLPDMTHNIHRAILSWWAVDGTASPPILTGDFELSNKLQMWHSNITNIISAPPPYNVGEGRWFFLNSGLLLSGDWRVDYLPAISVLPLSVSAIIRRETGGLGKSQRGKIAFAPIDPDLVHRNNLTPTGFGILQGCANRLTDVITVRGATFRHSLCSYKNATLTPLTGATPRYRLGCVIRRCSDRRAGSPAGVPKPPPP